MTFWLNQNVEYLENQVNQVAKYALGVEAPTTLRERFEKLRKESDSLFSERNTGRTCHCTGGAETFTTLRADADGFLCLAPAIAFIQGSDWVQKYMCLKVKKLLFEPVKVFNTNKKDDTRYPECNLTCLLNEWQDGPCFHRFVRVFKVNLRIHKSGYGGCRSLLGDDETNATIHLYYNTFYSIVIPSVDTLNQLPSKNIVSDSQMAYFKSIPPPTPSASKMGATAYPTVPLLFQEATQISASQKTQFPQCIGASANPSPPPFLQLPSLNFQATPFNAFGSPSQKMSIRNKPFCYKNAMPTPTLPSFPQEEVIQVHPVGQVQVIIFCSILTTFFLKLNLYVFRNATKTLKKKCDGAVYSNWRCQDGQC